MFETEFKAKIDVALDKIIEEIEKQDLLGDIDLDINDGILTLTTSEGIFVINRQLAAQEIWLSSPLSGPHHFAWRAGKWLSRNGDELFNLLAGELNIEFAAGGD